MMPFSLDTFIDPLCPSPFQEDPVIAARADSLYTDEELEKQAHPAGSRLSRSQVEPQTSHWLIVWIGQNGLKHRGLGCTCSEGLGTISFLVFLL